MAEGNCQEDTRIVAHPLGNSRIPCDPPRALVRLPPFGPNMLLLTKCWAFRPAGGPRESGKGQSGANGQRTRTELVSIRFVHSCFVEYGTSGSQQPRGDTNQH